MEIRSKLPRVPVPDAAELKCRLGFHKMGMWVYHEVVFRSVNDEGEVDPSRKIDGINTIVVEERMRTCENCGTTESHRALYY